MEKMTFDDPQEKFQFKNRVMCLQDIANEQCDGNLEDAKGIAQILFNRGSIKPIVAKLDPQEKAITQAVKEQQIHDTVNGYDEQEHARKIQKLNDKVVGCNIHKRVDLEFPNMFKAQEAETAIINKYGIEETEITIKRGVAYLVLRNVPDRILVMISREYTMDRAIEAGLGMASNAVEKLTGSVEYTAAKIAAPALQIGTKGAVSILRSLFKVATKTGATLVTATSQGVKQTASEISRDPDIIRAKHEIINAKDGIARTMVTGGGRNSGIRVVDED